MGNTDKFEMIANIYDTSERIQIAKVSSDAIREYLVDAKSKNAIDFGCGTGLVGMNLIPSLLIEKCYPLMPASDLVKPWSLVW